MDYNELRKLQEQKLSSPDSSFKKHAASRKAQPKLTKGESQTFRRISKWAKNNGIIIGRHL